MAISPCLGCGLTVDESNNLIIDGVVSEAWPHSCAVGTYNGLRCDPVSNALWTDPPTHVQYVGSSKAHFDILPDVWVYSGQDSLPTTDLELENESDCLSMDVLYIFTVGFGVYTGCQSGGRAQPRWRVEAAYDGAAWASVDTVNALFVQPLPWPSTGWLQSADTTQTFLSTIAPGGTARIRVRAKCDNAVDGTSNPLDMTIGQINFTLRMFGVSAR